ncbi:predicted protein, partial [Thalassiosira pseudonana CCMP1335]
LEWEEWDSATSPLSFAHHCLAGSFAGVMEHTLLYPLDTVKTCWQSQVLHKASGGAAGCVGITTGNNNIINATASPPSLSSTGFKRLWRGVQTMFIGCVPAHALYFSSYEIIKSMSLEYNKKAFLATLLHDCVMTPMDTMKQRMQLGHYDNLRHAFVSIVWGDGWKGLYRSLPVTVMTNIPYGMIMMTTNEWLHGDDHYERPFHFTTILLSGMGAGTIAAFLTAPLDRVKTRLQTQRMGMVTYYTTPLEAFRSILQEEGPRGLFRGTLPRVALHAPSVAISWTAYEMAK